MPQDIARNINVDLYEKLINWKKEEGNFGKCLGAVVSDFSDSQLAKAVYMYNYDRYKNTIILKSSADPELSKTGSAFGGGALWVIISIACAIAGFAAGYAVKRRKINK